LLITGIEEHRPSIGWRPLPARLSNRTAWRGNPDSTYSATRVDASAAGLRVHFANSEGESASIEYADSPRPADAIATPAALAAAPPGGSQGGATMLDNTSASLSFRVAQQVQLLPAVVANGVLIDLRPLIESLPGFTSTARWEVWLGPTAPADAVAQLERHGLLVQSEHTTVQRSTVLGRQGPALALKVLLSCGIAAAILSIAATAIAVAASGRRRSFELAALRVLGVGPRGLLGGLFLEQAMLLSGAVIVGVPAGGVAAWLTMSRIPEHSDSSPVPMSYSVHVLPITLFGVAMAVLLAATAFTAALALLRAAVPTRLREAEG
jgi:putative ABC transport system permease protein